MPQLLFCVYRCLLHYDEEEFLGRFATIVMFYGLISSVFMIGRMQAYNNTNTNTIV